MKQKENIFFSSKCETLTWLCVACNIQVYFCLRWTYSVPQSSQKYAQWSPANTDAHQYKSPREEEEEEEEGRFRLVHELMSGSVTQYIFGSLMLPSWLFCLPVSLTDWIVTIFLTVFPWFQIWLWWFDFCLFCFS